VGVHTMLAELHWSHFRAPLHDPLCVSSCVSLLCCGERQKVEETNEVIMAAGINGEEAGRPGIWARPDGSFSARNSPLHRAARNYIMAFEGDATACIWGRPPT
jgi:hypothetical protein